jgi:ABC-type Fe3+/spermidine/putrescine transport system ATPase subunit
MSGGPAAASSAERRERLMSEVAPGSPLVRLRGLSKRFGATEAVRPLDLDIAAGDFLAILGPSGCGKTTLLRMIGGFIAPSSGTIEIGGANVTRRGPERRPTNMVFQGYGLFPHMSVRQNIAYGLRIARRPAREIAERVNAILALGRLEDLADRGVHELSGGQQQRVALARALVMRPLVLLLDEPLAALDLKLRQAMQEELRRLHQQIGGTFVFVTHDQGEALALANRIAVMEAGRIVQEGSPEEIYSAPRTRFVATFIGAANVFAGQRSAGQVRLAIGASFADAGPDGPVVAVVRPEAMRIGGPDLAADVRLPARIQDLVFLGTHLRTVLQLEAGPEVVVHNPDLRHRADATVGQTVTVGWQLEDQRVVPDA